MSELSGLGRHLPNPHLLITPYVRREAVLSSRIEGTKTNLADLLLDEVDPRAVEQDPDDVREVRNYVRALEHGVRQLKKLPLGLRLVRESRQIRKIPVPLAAIAVRAATAAGRTA